MHGDKLLRIVFILIWAIAIAHIVAEYRYLYWIYRWLDIPMHFVGGLWLGLAGLWLYYYSGYLGSPSINGRTAMVALFSGFVVGLVWEAYEFAVWQLSGSGLPMYYLRDTTFDLVMDVSGALLAYALFMVARRRIPAQVVA